MMRLVLRKGGIIAYLRAFVSATPEDTGNYKEKGRKESRGSWLHNNGSGLPSHKLAIQFDCDKRLTIQMTEARLSTQEAISSHIREKVTNRVEPSNIAKA